MNDDLLRALFGRVDAFAPSDVGADPDEMNLDKSGKIVEMHGKRYLCLVPIPCLLGAYVGALAAEGDRPGTKFGEPLVLVRDEETAILQRDILEGRMRRQLLSVVDAFARQKQFDRREIGYDHPMTCPFHDQIVSLIKLPAHTALVYRGHRDGTAGTDKEPGFVQSMCSVHRRWTDLYYEENGFVVGEWPLRKVGGAP